MLLNQEGVITSCLGESLTEFFCGNCYPRARALEKIYTWKLFAYGNIFVHGKIKSKRKSLVKKEKKKNRS